MLRDATSLDLRALDAAIPSTPGATLLLSGSFAAGLAHARSDVDVHVVGGEPPACDLELDGARVQLTRVPDDAVALARSLSDGDLSTTAWSRAYFLSDRERWELLRLVESVPIRRAPAHDWIASPALRQATRRIVLGSAAHRIARSADDVRGLLEVGEHAAARDLVRQSLRDAATMALAALDDLAASDRLLLPRLRRSGLATSAASWLVVAFEECDGDLRLLPRIQALAALVQLVAWDGAIAPEAFALLEPRGLRRWTRSPHVWLVRRPDAVTLADSGGHGFRLPLDLARAWLLSETGDVDAVREASAQAGTRLARASVASGIARLVDLGLLEREPTEREPTTREPTGREPIEHEGR